MTPAPALDLITSLRGDLLDAIVLLCCCPVRCRVVELVPHFTLHALRTALYMLSLGR